MESGQVDVHAVSEYLPNLNLSFSQAQSMGNLDPPSSRQVSIEVEFFL